MNTIRIDGRSIGPDASVFFIAEAGVNHNGDLGLAKQLVDAAVEAGADAVKFQTFRAEEVATALAPKATYQVKTTGRSESQLEMLRRLELSAEAHRELMEYCRVRRILFMSTPFDAASADFLETLHLPIYKIPSGEITNWPFLEHIAQKRKPIILSTGMSDLDEVIDAVRVLRAAECSQLAILHCTSNYPSNPAHANLRAMMTMAETFHVPVGLSDHTMGVEVALAATALGASIVEKHFTIDRSLPGPDHGASLDPDELRVLVNGIRIVESALGDGRKCPNPSETEVRDVARRSIVANQTIPSGTLISRNMIAFKRPGTGIPPSKYVDVVGHTTLRIIPADSLIELKDIK